MLSVFLLLTNMASAQVVCTPSTGTKDKNLVVCGDDRIATYSTKNQKVESVIVVFKDNKLGAEKSVTFKNPGLTVQQINNGQAMKSAAIKKESEKLKKEWNLKEVNSEVSSFEITSETKLFATADLKTKASLDKIKKVNRNVASDGPPIAGGIRGGSGK